MPSIQKFLESPVTKKTFPKYPHAQSKPTQNNTTEPQKNTETTTQIEEVERNPEPAQVPQTSTSTSYSESLQTEARTRPQHIIRMKIVPPFRREHFQYPQLLQQDIEKAMVEILNSFQMKHRSKITISRTNLVQQGKTLQILMVTAPGEAEEDVARAKLSGLQIMGRTVFPTGDEFWRFYPSEYPKRAMIRISNLPVLLDTDELEELLNLPPETELNEPMERETVTTEAGKVHTGRARIPIIIQSKSHEEKLFSWSMWRNSDAGRLEWNKIPIYMAVPRLHRCARCEAEGRRQFIGHDEKWCRITRQTTKPIEEEAQSVEEEVQIVAQTDQIKENEIEQNCTPAEVNRKENAEADGFSSNSSSDDDGNNDEAVTTEQKNEQDGRKRNWQEVKKKKRKRSNKSTKSLNSGKTTNSSECPVRKSMNLNG